MVLFARRVAHFVTVERTVTTTEGHETAIYVVNCELFFASSNDLYTQFEYALDPENVASTCTPLTSGTPPPSPP